MTLQAVRPSLAPKGHAGPWGTGVFNAAGDGKSDSPSLHPTIWETSATSRFNLDVLRIISQGDTMKVIIVGAGIAGLAAGIGLRRGGHQVTVSPSTNSPIPHSTRRLESLTLTPPDLRTLQPRPRNRRRAKHLSKRLARSARMEIPSRACAPGHGPSAHPRPRRHARDPEGHGVPGLPRALWRPVVLGSPS
jgi:hypothetical protein